jgi:hypothetical protein
VLLAGVCLGMALLTRPGDALVFSLPFLALYLRPFRLLWLLIGSAGPTVLLVLYNTLLTGQAHLTLYTFYSAYDRLGFGPDVGPYGFTVGQGLWGTSFKLESLQAHLFGWPFYLTLAFAAMPFAVGAARRWDFLFLAPPVLVVVFFTAYFGLGTPNAPRYYSTTVICLALLSARGFVELFNLPRRLLPGRAGGIPARITLPVLLGAVLLVYECGYYLPAQVPLYRGYDRMSAAPILAVERAHLRHALVFVRSGSARDWWSYATLFPQNSPLLDGSVVYARDLGAQNARLIRRCPGMTPYVLDRLRLSKLPRPSGVERDRVRAGAGRCFPPLRGRRARPATDVQSTA